MSNKMEANIRDSEHCKRVALTIQNFNAKRSFTDLCFVCAQGRRVYAHKLLFFTVSTMLKEMMLEIPDNLETYTVLVPDIEVHMMELILDFLYEGSVRVNQHEFENFQSVMETLGIGLTPPSGNEAEESNATEVVQPVQPMPTQQFVYIPAVPNVQGQMQYALASPGQTQVLPAPQLIAQNPTTQVMQNGTQMQQQGNMAHIVQQTNSPIGNQMVMGGQIMQCHSQIMVSGNQQQTVMNTNQLQVAQVGQNNYVTTQQQPQYVIANTNQMTTTTTPTQFTPPQEINRTQPTRTNSKEDGGRMNLVESIKSILEENGAELDTLTAKFIRERLEQKLNRDLSHLEKDIDVMLRSDRGQNKATESDQSAPNGKPKTSKQKRKRKSRTGPKSDDELDIDFNPRQQQKSVQKNKKKK